MYCIGLISFREKKPGKTSNSNLTKEKSNENKTENAYFRPKPLSIYFRLSSLMNLESNINSSAQFFRTKYGSFFYQISHFYILQFISRHVGVTPNFRFLNYDRFKIHYFQR